LVVKILKTVITVVLLVGSVPFTANADFGYPKLPWYEKYFFPLGALISPAAPYLGRVELPLCAIIRNERRF
jgi:hypothetical protein